MYFFPTGFLQTNSSTASQHHQSLLQHNVNNSQTENPMLNLEIGGLVTNMQKSFLHDVSPPSFSSMEASIDRMNNSLITSADFSNINFLQSTNSLDFGGTDISGHGEFNLMGKITNDGYTLSDMIRDRKALESLTMSSEGTLIKDMHIGQIDDISLTLSKTASGCSTMDNSTESVEANNRTVEILTKNRAFDGASSSSGNELNRTMILTDEMIGDITYNLVENSMYGSIASEQALNVTHSLTKSQQSGSENSSKPTLGLDQTICLSTDGVGGITAEKTENSTFDCQENITPNNRCETPEGLEKPVASLKYYESTPQTTSVRYNKQHYTPTLKMVDDVNISPIVATSAPLPHNVTRVLNDTFEHEQRVNKANKIINTNTFSGKLPLNATVEMLENIENPNGTYEKDCRRLEHPSPVSMEMKNVMDLAQAEANLLASNNNEEEFDHMLDEFSKVELNAEQLKMKKSLDSIKKRFNYGPNKDRSHGREISREAKDMRDMMRASADLLGDEDHSSKDYLNMTIDITGKSDMKVSKEPSLESPHASSEATDVGVRSPLKDSVTSSISESKISNGLTMSSVSNSSGCERLLSRRSRLYDDFNLSTLSPSSVHGSKLSLGSSYTVHKDDENVDDIRPNVNETENVNGQKTLEMVQEKTEVAADDMIPDNQAGESDTQETSAAQYKLAEKRERDRDRFKTIKINKNRSGGSIGQSGLELNVPCIDDYGVDVNTEAVEDLQQSNSRISRRDQTVSPVFNNNKSEVEIVDADKTTSKINPNYLTYKKPKDKQTNVRNLPEIAPASTNSFAVASDVTASKPRSLSRPRYLSGLTKFSAVSKATSADELEKSMTRQTNLNVTTSALNSGLSKGTSAASITQNRTLIGGQLNENGTTAELKSPMGIKSKSFHNLSSNHASASNTTIGSGGGVPAPRTFGLRKPSTISTEKLVSIFSFLYGEIFIYSRNFKIMGDPFRGFLLF